MATSRKNPVTPDNRENDPGGQLAGGSSDLPGTAKSRSKAVPAPQAAASKSRLPETPGSKGSGAKGLGAKGSGTKGSDTKEAASVKTGSRTDGPKGASSRRAASKAPSASTPGSSAGTGAVPGANTGANTGAGATAGSSGDDQRMSDEERQRRIAEAAYRKAQERGFSGDRQLDDWLEAEREFNRPHGQSR